MRKTNLTYVRKSYGVNPKKKFVKCVLDYEINLDKIPGIQYLAQMPDFENYINTLAYQYNVPVYDTDCEGIPSEYGVIMFTTEGMAQCADGDTFDESLGKKLALTRAQRKAFSNADEFYGNLCDITENVFEGLYCLQYGALKSSTKCKIHEHELTGHEMVNY